MGRILLWTVLVMVLCLGVAVGYYNAQRVSFHYLAGSVEIPLIWLLALAIIVSVVVTLLVCASRFIAYQAEIRRLRKQLTGAESELRNLRSLPLRDA
jgi:lipopolysaccharide assembly protein A